MIVLLETSAVSAILSNPVDIRDWPLWWFARLEAALERGDFQTAAQAQQELVRLGVRVHYSFPRHSDSRRSTSQKAGATTVSTSAPIAGSRHRAVD
jgi:hypothetical protein